MEIDNSSNDVELTNSNNNIEESKISENLEENIDSTSTVSISLSSEEQNSSQSPSVTSSATLAEQPTQPQQSQVIQSSITLHHDAKLIQVCGEEPFHFIPVPLTHKSLNLEDVFIMQSDAYMFVWSSNNVDSQKKAKAIQMAKNLKAEIGCQRAVQVLEFGEEHPTFIFCLGLPKGSKLEVTKEHNDVFQVDEDDEVLEPEFFLYKLVTIEGKLNFIPIDEPEINQEMFESNSCFILDCEHEIFIWQGKTSSKQERECCLPLAKKIQSSFDRPETFTNHCLTYVFDGAEGCIFKSKFKSGWKEKQIFSYLGLNKKKSDLSFDVSSMHLDKEIPTISLGSSDNKGKLLIWNCSLRGKWSKVDEDDFGIFYSNKSYVCHFIYRPENKNSIKSVIFYWEGMYSNHRNYISYKFGLYKDIQKKMQSLQSDDPIEYRISQNKEPIEFFQLFGTEVLILNDEISTNSPKPMMIQVRGNKGSCRGTQLTEISASKLNSMDSFVFIFPAKVTLVWYGKGSNEEERLLSSELVTFLPSEYEGPTMEFEEGQESDSFWKFIGGKLEYPSINYFNESNNQDEENDVQDENSKFKPKTKLFLCTESTGIFKAEEVRPFSQLDLNPEENIILDVFNHIFLWKGSKSTDSKFEQSLQVVKEYISTIPVSPSGRSKDSVKFTILNDGEESELFKSYFVSWKFVAPKVFIDPLLKPKENIVKLDVKQTVVENKPDDSTEKVQEKVEEPVKSEEKVEEVKSEEKAEESVQPEEKVEEPVQSEEKAEEPVQSEEKVEEPVKSEEKIEEPVKSEEKIEEVVKSEEKVEEVVEDSTEKVEEPITSEISQEKVDDNAEAKDPINSDENIEENLGESKNDLVSNTKQKKGKSNKPSQSPTVGGFLAPNSISTSSDLFFAYEPFHSPIGSPKQSRKGGKKGGKNRNRNNNNNVQLSSSPSKSNHSIESLHLDSTNLMTQPKKNKNLHNRTGSYNH